MPTATCWSLGRRSSADGSSGSEGPPANRGCAGPKESETPPDEADVRQQAGLPLAERIGSAEASGA